MIEDVTITEREGEDIEITISKLTTKRVYNE